MLRCLSELKGYAIEALDGKIGKVADFYMNGENWRLIYLVIHTGSWLPGRKVLLRREGLGTPDWEKKVFPVTYTIEFIKKSPPVDSQKALSRQNEIALSEYFSWDPYWGVLPRGGKLHRSQEFSSAQAEQPGEKGDPHLRSFNEMKGYSIRAFEGKAGHAEDFIIEDNDWSIPLFSVDTKDWLPAKKVLLSTDSIEKVDGQKKFIEVNLTEAAVREAPPFDPSKAVSHKWVSKLYDYYGRPVE